jgi:CoA:oxalate CoA-transferase
MTMSVDRSRPLDGIRVVDFTSMVSGPYCTRLLADMGAEVIKIEPASGDLIRYAAPLNPAGSRYFQTFNAGKRSMVLDLKSVRGAEVAVEIAARCDVLVENFRPGVMAKLGLGYDALSERNPKLVYCSISGFGQDGPMRDWPAYAPIVHALSGFDSVFIAAQDDASTPPIASVQIADVLTGAFAFGAIQSALIKRFRTGHGDHVDSTLIESAMALVSGDLQVPQTDKPQRIMSFKAVPTRDGFVMPVILTDKAFRSLAEIIDARLLTDTRFRDNRGRGEHATELREAIAVWTSTRTARECQEAFMHADVPCAVYATPTDVLNNRHLIERGTFATLDDGCGTFKVNNAPFRFRHSESGIRELAPGLGAHTRAVLSSLLGYDAATVEKLREARVVR